MFVSIDYVGVECNAAKNESMADEMYHCGWLQRHSNLFVSWMIDDEQPSII